MRFDKVTNELYLVGGKGDTWRNGYPVAEGKEEKLEVYDRVAMGDQLMMLRWKMFEQHIDPLTRSISSIHGSLNASGQSIANMNMSLKGSTGGSGASRPLMMSAEEAVAEFQEGLMRARTSGGSRLPNESHVKHGEFYLQIHMHYMHICDRFNCKCVSYIDIPRSVILSFEI